MPYCLASPPYSPVEFVTETIHGVAVEDRYRWLEDAGSAQTRQWLSEQRTYARSYLDSLPGRDVIQQRVHDYLAVETFDSLLSANGCYFFRKRLPNQQQPSLYMRRESEGGDELLLDPQKLERGDYISVKPLVVSDDARFLLYEIKQGGERTGTFALMDISRRVTLPDTLPHGYLRGFSFSPDNEGFYYVHELPDWDPGRGRTVCYHRLGTPTEEDRVVFHAEEDGYVRLGLSGDNTRLGISVCQSGDVARTSFYVKMLDGDLPAVRLISCVTYSFGPIFRNGRIFAITNQDAPHFRIVEVLQDEANTVAFRDIVPAGECVIRRWVIVGEQLFVSYCRGARTEIAVYDLNGSRLGTMPVSDDETVRLLGAKSNAEEVLFEAESFKQPVGIYRYIPQSGKRVLWSMRNSPLQADNYASTEIWYASKDGTQIPMSLFGRKDVLEGGCHPAIMTSYGGYGVPMTPQFSVLVAILAELGCLFALPNIRGGGGFGSEWHNAAKRRNRQTAYDDFIFAAEALIASKRSLPQLAIFGGSNSGLLVGAALTQRPDLFCAVLCMVPLLDMVRYHLFDTARVWKDEFGTADDPEDFAALFGYSPYHRVQPGVHYPPVMFVSGDADRNCNPLHARKMTAQLQAATSSGNPVILDYSEYRGHSPVLPLNERIMALTDRLAFLCAGLQLPIQMSNIARPAALYG
jgi:prolyl oligopeptidase